ncbi:TetR/AcrR family transcriptional regulator [Leucobacter massiliensis]|uniref:TetR family transcriptional regulator n=1 Tax=Leucobacter massiliensis TaxID=1686285 RepID=A0A2S9QRB8_9MICO|nr:TetR/AcrR family transcriptional regulator [Leucobacter massiliensis]PRI12131.1 TetR family transcriptional regulator [Leucobacter massiliensis]
MPKINAATVAEHRAQQERHLLRVAHAFLEETGRAPSMAELAERAGLARSSVYHYFGSSEALLAALVRDVFPRWAERITGAMAAAPDAGARVLAYAVENLRLVHEGAHAVASALSALTPEDAIDAESSRMHLAIREPLIDALTELGVAEPESVGELVNAVVHAATRLLESGSSFESACASMSEVLGPMAGRSSSAPAGAS